MTGTITPIDPVTVGGPATVSEPTINPHIHTATTVASSPITFVQLGRFGDLILLLPAFKRWGEITKMRPNVVVAEQFQTIFEGVTYIRPIVAKLHWSSELDTAILKAYGHYDNVIVTQLHGRNWSVKGDTLASYSLSMWNRAHLLDEYAKLPVVFDHRDYAREFSLFKSVQQISRSKKPLLLHNFNGVTSRFPYPNEVLNALEPFRKKYNLFDLYEAKAHRIYDLLGLMDKARGLLTIDTSTLHLAAASTVPYIAFTRDGQGGSIPKGNCVLRVPYSKTPEMMNEILKAVENFKSEAA